MKILTQVDKNNRTTTIGTSREMTMDKGNSKHTKIIIVKEVNLVTIIKTTEEVVINLTILRVAKVTIVDTNKTAAMVEIGTKETTKLMDKAVEIIKDSNT